MAIRRVATIFADFDLDVPACFGVLRVWSAGKEKTALSDWSEMDMATPMRSLGAPQWGRDPSFFYLPFRLTS
jgi:hypothetical protein